MDKSINSVSSAIVESDISEAHCEADTSFDRGRHTSYRFRNVLPFL